MRNRRLVISIATAPYSAMTFRICSWTRSTCIWSGAIRDRVSKVFGMAASNSTTFSSDSLPMNETVKWGVLGTAAIATGRIMPALKESPHAALLAVASRDPERARAVAQNFGVPRVYAGYEKLLADSEIDVVYIPLPNDMHFEWSGRALESGKHVLCEKPLCLTTDDALRLCAARDRAG